jgi:hypothetical protein
MTKPMENSLVAIALAVWSAASPVHAQDTSGNDGWAVRIPPSAMQEMLRCRHQQRPEEECFAQLVQAMGQIRAQQAQRAGQGSLNRT